MDSLNELSPTASGLTSQSINSDLNLQIAICKNLGGIMTAIEQRMAETDQLEVTQRSQASKVSSTAQLDQVVVPSVAALKGATHTHAEVDRWISHLTDLNKSGKLKLQREGHDTVFVKRQVPWPQNFVWGGGGGGGIIKPECCMTT